MTIKPIRFGTYGPYELNREKDFITSDTLDLFWMAASSVSNGTGVYIIASKIGDDLTPWYVGKTDSGFKKRFYQHLRSTRHIFAKLAESIPREQLVVMFMARHTEGGKLRKARKSVTRLSTKSIPTIDRLEYDILKSALKKNPHLLNKSKRVYLAKLQVPGFSGPDLDADTVEAKSLRALL